MIKEAKMTTKRSPTIGKIFPALSVEEVGFPRLTVEVGRPTLAVEEVGLPTLTVEVGLLTLVIEKVDF